MHPGIEEAIKVTIKEIIYGRIFLVAIWKLELPRHFDARLYSRSRIMITWVLSE